MVKYNGFNKTVTFDSKYLKINKNEVKCNDFIKTIRKF